MPGRWECVAAVFFAGLAFFGVIVVSLVASLALRTAAVNKSQPGTSRQAVQEPAHRARWTLRGPGLAWNRTTSRMVIRMPGDQVAIVGELRGGGGLAVEGLQQTAPLEGHHR